MEAFSLSSSISIASRSAVRARNDKCNGIFPKNSNKSMVICHSSDNHEVKSSVISSVFTEKTSALISADNAPALNPDGTEHLVSSPGRQPNSISVDMRDEGIGIVNFLRGNAFLITGVTGFLGKVLIEKILRMAPDFVKIYVMIKAKNKEAALERLKNEVINAELFERLKQIHGTSYQAYVLSKLIPVVGNVCETNLGLDEDAARFMTKEVEV